MSDSLVLGLTIGLALGWFYGVKRLPPTAQLASALGIGTKSAKRSTNSPSPKQENLKLTRYKIFEQTIPRADIVFLGDSLTHRGNFNEFFDINKRIYNRGISGDTSFDVYQRLNEVQRLKPSHVFLMIGINDLYNHDTSPEEVIKNIKKINAELKANGSTVYIQEIIQCEPSLCQETSKEVELANQLLRSTFPSESIIPLGELSQAKGLASIYTDDGIHLNANGYQLWIEKLKPYISRIS
jgi:lysophospholipase L1-like esterase